MQRGDRLKDKRVSFLVPPELANRLNSIPWGVRSMLLRIMTEKLVDAFESQGQIMAGAVLSGEFELVYKPSQHRPVPKRDSPEEAA